ncbi:MAG: hypothetical protein IT359_18960 [Gemmatimonadaceae bacterium]|nr:hypothetical protein [Gemmatimonadaceae bacterium]
MRRFRFACVRRRVVGFVAILSVGASLAGCGGGGEGGRGAVGGEAGGVAGKAAVGEPAATPVVGPHGGMLVPLGDGANQLEFVVDTGSTAVFAHVLDASGRTPVRVAQPRIDLKMLDVAEGNVVVYLVLAAKPDAKLGETLGDTPTFLGFAPELKGRAHFRAVVQRVEVGGKVYTDVPVTYPAATRP